MDTSANKQAARRERRARALEGQIERAARELKSLNVEVAEGSPALYAVGALAVAARKTELRRGMLQVLRPSPYANYRAVECATLGTLWRDIEDEDGNLFAMQVPAPIAEDFVKDPALYSNTFASVAMLRGWALENMHRWLHAAPKKPQKRPAGKKAVKRAAARQRTRPDARKGREI